MDYFKLTWIIFLTIWLRKTSAERQQGTETRRQSAPEVWPVVFFSDPRLKRDTAEFTIVKHVTRKTSKRNPGYRSRRRPKPVYGPPNYTHGTPINEYIFSGNHGSSSFDAPYESSKYTPPTSSEIIVEHQPYPSGPARQRPPVSPYKHVSNNSPYSSVAESYPPYRPKPVKTFGEPPQYPPAQPPHELYVPLNSIPIQSDVKYKSPPSTSYGVPISPQSNSYRDEQPPFPAVKNQHSAPADTYGPPSYSISNYSTAYDGTNYDKTAGGNFAEPPNDHTSYDGTSGASYDSAAGPSPTYNAADYQNYPPTPQTQYKPEEFLPTHQQYETHSYKEPTRYLPPVQPETFPIQGHDNSHQQNYQNHYDDYETFINEAAESKKIQKSTSKQSEHFESGIGNTSFGANIEVPSDEYVDELLRSDIVSTTKRTTPRRRVNDRPTSAPHYLDTEDLRDAFSSGSASYPQALQRPKETFGTRIKGKISTDTIKAKNFVLLSAANNRTELHHPPVIAANPPLSPSYLFGKNVPARLPTVRTTNGAAKNRTKSIQIISIQKSQSHSYYAGTMAPLTAKDTGGFQAPDALNFGGDGSLSVVSTNMQVGSGDDTVNGKKNEPKTMFWNGKVLPANHKV